MEMRPFGKLLPPERAVARLLRAARPVGEVEKIRLDDAVGRIPARTLRARSDVPPFARATWDGYAFRARSTRGARPERPATFRLVGEVYAEGGFRGRVGPHEAVAIATGGPMPAGTDTVLIFEEALVGRGWLTVRRPVRPRDRLAEPGEDFARGAPLAARGEPLTPAALGALAASGLTHAPVVRRPRVAILPNGNELVEPGRPLGQDQIYESNNIVLSAFVRSVGAEPRTEPPLPDDPVAIERAIRRALRSSDLVLVTGGSSVGERDFLPRVLARLGPLLFHGLAVRPGKPTLAVRAAGRLVIGMPGHPTSCLANGFWMLLPVLARLAGRAGAVTVPTPVRLSEPYEIEPARLATVVPLSVHGGTARPTFRGSSAITSLTEANAYLILPPGAPSLRRGERRVAEVLPFPLGPTAA
jgi:molybdopterin molybdotransferase